MSSILATMSPAKNEKQDIQLSMWCIEVDISERNNFHIGHFCIIVTLQNSASCLLVDAIGTYNVTSILSTYIGSYFKMFSCYFIEYLMEVLIAFKY